MPRNIRIAPGGMVFHVSNRAVADLRLFREDDDYREFEEILTSTLEHDRMRLCAYCLLPDHWRMVLWPRKEGDLGAFLQKVSVSHTRVWQKSRNLVGTGHLYQGRYKSFPVQNGDWYWQTVRHVEAAAKFNKLVKRADQWRWCSLYRRLKGNEEQQAILSEGPVPLPHNWKNLVNKAEMAEEYPDLEVCHNRSRPFGDEKWVQRTAKRLNLESTLNPRGRPPKVRKKRS